MEDKNSTGSSNSTDVAVSPPAQPPPSPPPPSTPPPPTTMSSPPPENSPPPPSQSPPPPSPSSPPPLSSQSSPPQSPPPPNPISPPPPSNSNSNPPPSQNNPSDPHPVDSINISPPSGINNNNNNGNGNNNNNNNNKQWDLPPPPPPPLLDSSPYSSQNSNGSPALSPTNESSNGPLPSNNNNGSSMLSIPLVTAVAAGVALLIIVMLLLFFSCRRKTNRERNDKMPYYNIRPTANNYYNSAATQPLPPPTNGQTDGGGGGGAPLYNNTAHNQNHNNMHANHDHELNALTQLPGGAGSKLDWPTPPPPNRGAAPVTSSDTSLASNSSPYGPVVPPPAPVLQALGQSGFTYEELSAATGGFSETNLLGEGGFGYVHKGTLPNGKEIAVKSLKSGSGSQGEREFKAEVDIISRVHHRHLVSLVGYCIAGDKRLLVYEYVPNNNLEYHLHGKGQPVMDWPARLKIALGSAKGLAYLHEDCQPRIIHRDIKSSNILLDFTWEAKVGDFGLAKLNADNNTHVSTRVMGTFGYLALEYASTGKLTEKSDVFSFGVMLLELITGRRPVEPTRAMEDTLVDWARPLCLRALEDGNFDEIADPYLEKNYQVEEMARMVACAGSSIRHSARKRPKVSQIVRALEGDVSLEDLNNGIKPSHASMFGGGTTSSSRSYDLDNSSYTEDLKKLRKMAEENPDGRYVSSEYGATSEYGLNPSSSSSEFGSRDQSPPNNVKPSF